MGPSRPPILELQNLLEQLARPGVVDAAFILFGYLLGAVPFALIIGLRGGVDIRTVGSGNTGATNLGRTLGARWGLAGFACDFAKGLVPALAAACFRPGWLPVAAGGAAVMGHMFPVYLRFRGGKGVATGAGVFVGLAPWAALAAFFVWGVLVKATRYMALASMAGGITLAAAAPLTPVYGADRTVVSAAAAAMALLVVLRHRSNIRRLLDGSEPKLGSPKQPHELPGAGREASSAPGDAPGGGA